MKKTEWFDNEEDWVLKRPIIFGKNLVNLTFIEIGRLVKLLGGAERYQDVLDLCCGIGRHSIELAGHGFNVTGVDITKPYLEIAKSTAEKAGLSINFVQSDMRNFKQVESFDLIVNLCTSFGYFEDIDDDFLVLQNIFESLRPGGKFVIELLGKEVIASTFKQDERHEIDGCEVIASSRILDDWGSLECKRQVIKDGVETVIVAYHRLYSATEMKAYLKKAGFKNSKVYGDFSGSPYDNTAKSMIIISER